MSYQRELAVAIEAAREAGAIVLRYYRTDVGHWEKSEDNPLTLADLESDRAIGAKLRAAFPDDAILSEETVDDASRLAKERVWIVDPMDGTKEFTKRIPELGVSIGLVVAGEPVVGVIFNPVADGCVWASKGDGCFRNGTRVRVSPVTRLDAVVIASRTEISRNQFDPYAGWFKEIRPVGSIAWKLACVASGEGDLNVSVAPKNEWDVCAGDEAKTLIEAGMAAGPIPLVEAFCQRERERAQGA